jgi:hypothetical protein
MPKQMVHDEEEAVNIQLATTATILASVDETAVGSRGDVAGAGKSSRNVNSPPSIPLNALIIDDFATAEQASSPRVSSTTSFDAIER